MSIRRVHDAPPRPNPPHGTIHLPTHRFFKSACALFFGAVLVVPCPAGETRFTVPDSAPFTTNEGVVNLLWEGPEEATFELQQSPSPEFPEAKTRTRYQGPDPGSVVSGLPDGSHHFRVRAITADGTPGEWSAPLEVRVEFMATMWVVTLLIGGAAIFLATITVIITGHLRTRQAHAES